MAPFLNPDLVWDFQLERVASINVSGHKYGLTYPGLGFAIWRDAAHLPKELIFHVNYLGGDMPTFTLNFSRPGNQIVGEYYTFLRLGRMGFTEVMQNLRETATWTAQKLGRHPEITIVSDGSELPVVCLEVDASFGAHDVSHELRTHGWQVPAYPLPEGRSDVTVLRIVVREGFSGDFAEAFVADVDAVMARLRETGGSAADSATHHFAH